MTEEENNPRSEPKPRGLVSGKTELWTWASFVLAGLTLVAWVLVFLRLGSVSIVLHAAIVPTLGVLTIPLMAWGLVTTLIRPPALQKPRIAGFGVLLAVGYFCNVPLFAPPVSTEDWKSPEARLPMNGEHYVIAGGPDRQRNYHATTAAYRWGYDFTVRRDGKKFQLDGKDNEDYPCFGKAVVAPLGGKVIEAISDVPDNVPGEVVADPKKTFGNHVIIEHAPDVFVFVAHMKSGSIIPEIGDVVEAQNPIGQCGNSGRSIEPHVHVHAQNTQTFPYSESLPLQFTYVRGDRRLTGMPVGETNWNIGDGDVVRP